MRAVVLEQGSVTVRTDYPQPQPTESEVRLRVLCAGICETDLQLMRGYMGFRGVLGHEFVGIAESGPHAGRRVVGEINCSCRQCETCLAGRPTHCPHRSVIGILNHDGAFADYLVVPQHNLHPIPDSIPTEVAVFVEPLAAALQIPSQIPLRGDDRVVVLGDGRLGNLCAQVLANRCRHLLVVGKHPEKLNVLRALGIETCLLSDQPNDRAADVVVDCTGSDTGLPTALKLVRPRGTVVLKTTVAGSQQFAWAPFVIDEITLVGSRCGPFDQAIAALKTGQVDVLPLITARFDLANAVTALEQARSPSALKVLLNVSSG